MFVQNIVTFSVRLLLYNTISITLRLFMWSPLMRECLGSIPRAGKFESGFYPSAVGKMSSNYETVGDCCGRLQL